jgi:iron complex outermembrane receptor protein
MNRIWLLAILPVFVVFNLSAQERCNLSVYGLVTDEHDGSALSFATIWIPSEGRGVAADEKGAYRIESLCAGNYQLIIRHIACTPDTIAINLQESMQVNAVLEHHLAELSEVQVDGTSDELLVAGSEQLAKTSFYEQGGKPLGEILKALNGVNTLRTGSNISKPVIGGFSGNRVQIMNHGVQHQAQQWGSEHAPELDPFAASDYKVIKGPGALKYTGGALGGVIVAEPAPLPYTNGIGGELNALYAFNNRMGNASAMLEGNWDKVPGFAWRIQSSAKRSGNIKTPHYYQKNTGVKELNTALDLGYKRSSWNTRLFYSKFNSEIGIFSGAHIGNLTDLQSAINRSEPRPEDREGFSYKIRRPYQRIIHELAKVEVNWYPERWGKVQLKWSRQFNIREEFDKETPRNAALAALNVPEFSLSLESYVSNLNWELPNKGAFSTELGLQYLDQRNTVNSFTDFIPDYKQTANSFYFLEHWKKEKISLEAGLRADVSQLKVNKLLDREYVNFQHSFLAFTSSFSFSYQWKKEQNTRFSLSYAERAPGINELYSDGLHHGSASLEYGNRFLKKEKSYNINFSHEFKAQAWTYQLYAYIQFIEDYIYLRPQGLDLTIRGAFPAFAWEQTTALLRGLDQSLAYTLTPRWSLENKLSMLWGNNLDSNNFLINMPANRIETAASYSIKTEAQSLLKLKLGKQYVFRQKRFNKSEEILAPPGGYLLLFFSGSYRWSLSEKQQMELGIRIDNLLDRKYRDYMNRFRFYTDEQGRNITLRIKYNF